MDRFEIPLLKDIFENYIFDANARDFIFVERESDIIGSFLCCIFQRRCFDNIQTRTPEI